MVTLTTDILKFIEKLLFHPLASIPFFSFLIFLYIWLSTTHNTKRITPPSPPKLPIFGHIFQMGKLPHRSLRSLSQRYGELMLLHIGSKHTLVVSSANAAREIMKTHDVVFANRPKFNVTTKIMYNNKDIAFANYGEYWRQMKSICVQQMLSSAKVNSFRYVREEETAVMVENIWRSATSTSVGVNLSEIFTRFTNDVVCRAAFGRKNWEEEGYDHVKEILDDFSKVLGSFNIGDFLPWLGWVDRISGADGRASKVAKLLDKWIEKIIDEHLNHQNDEDRKKGNKVQDFVDVLLEIQKDNRSTLSRESIKALLVDMIAGGTHTSSALLEWTIAELLMHPRVMKELQNEVRKTVKGKAFVLENDLESMKYLKTVLKETLRIHPPLPLLIFHESSQDVKINGYNIDTGTQTIINAWAIQRDPTAWDDPEEFRPERFLNSLVDFKGHNFELIPFGAGRRGCPGISFGIANVELVLANLIYSFDWKLPDEAADQKTFNMVECAGNTVRKRDPLVLIPVPYLLEHKVKLKKGGQIE